MKREFYEIEIERSLTDDPDHVVYAAFREHNYEYCILINSLGDYHIGLCIGTDKTDLDRHDMDAAMLINFELFIWLPEEKIFNRLGMTFSIMFILDYLNKKGGRFCLLDKKELDEELRKMNQAREAWIIARCDNGQKKIL